MSEIKIHIFHIGKVCVAPELPFGGEHYSALRASGVLDRKSKRLWLPVSAYLIECAHGNVLFDCGWHRDMSPHGSLSAGHRSARSARCRCILRIRLLSKAVRPSTSSSRRGASRLSIGTRCCSRILTATTRTASSWSRTRRKFSFRRTNCASRRTAHPSTASATMRTGGAARRCRPSTGMALWAPQAGLTMFRRRDARDGQHSGPFQGPVRAQDHGGGREVAPTAATRKNRGSRCCSPASPTTARRRKSRSRGSGHRVGSGTALRASPTTISMSNRARLHYKRVNRQRQRRCLFTLFRA